MPEGVHCILWLNDSISALVERGLAPLVEDGLCDPRSDHYRRQGAQDLLVVGYSAVGGREYEVAFANRAGELPGLKGGEEYFWLDRDRAPAAFGLWRSDFAIAARPLPDVSLAGFEIDIAPPEAPQLTGAKSGQGGRQQQCTRAWRVSAAVNQASDFSGVGRSTPTSSLRLPRLSRPMVTFAATWE